MAAPLNLFACVVAGLLHMQLLKSVCTLKLSTAMSVHIVYMEIYTYSLSEFLNNFRLYIIYSVGGVTSRGDLRDTNLDETAV